MCQNRPGGAGLGVKHSLLLCCREDLCNHVDSVNRMSFNDSISTSGKFKNISNIFEGLWGAYLGRSRVPTITCT